MVEIPMKVAVLKETLPGELRTAATPDSIRKLVELGIQVTVEEGSGAGSSFSDDEYEKAGAQLTGNRRALLAEADIILRLNNPDVEEARKLKRGAIHIGFTDPLNNPDLIKAFAKAGVSVISMEFIPRTTLAQKMDALSSQANLGGYVAVILAANRLNKLLPMMMTPAGTIAPSRVFVIGAGVAGLQAIATARRLGARVEAFDTRPVVKEQVQSLGAKFIEVDLGETGETKDGYAKALTEEQMARQREEMAKRCAMADVVITTAQVFGRKAPLIITEDILKQMKPGSVIVDMAAETGGNVAGTILDKEVTTDNGVTIIGLGKLPARVAAHASQMYAANLYNLIEHIWDKEEGKLKLNLRDEIIDGCLIVHDGEVRNPLVRKTLENRG